MLAGQTRVLLLILDGAGLSDTKVGNAVTRETMPTLFKSMARYGFATLEASGRPVGLDDGQVGNSEIGHLTIGAGFTMPSTLSRIQASYRDGSWHKHLLWEKLREARKLNIVGLLSEAGIHGHVDSLVQSATIAHECGIMDIVVHPVLDGVDSQAGSAPVLYNRLQTMLSQLRRARIGIVSGRRWFADRSGNLDVTRVFSNALTGCVKLPRFSSEALEAHTNVASESSFLAHANSPEDYISLDENVLLTQHRADRAIQAAKLLGEKNTVYSLVELGDVVPSSHVFFSSQPLVEGLGFEFLRHGVKSIRISESCKFPHVTYFLNGLNRSLEGTEVCIDSIPEAEFSDRPEMSILEVTHQIQASIIGNAGRVVVANIPNLDQIGHLGRFDLAAKAAHSVDQAVKRILETCKDVGWTTIITSDHGNADRTVDEAGRPFGSHTDRPVPITLISPHDIAWTWKNRSGSLANVAPTLLAALGLPQPSYMADSLIE